MKKTRRIFSILLALVFCISAMSYNVLAAVTPCPYHPNSLRNVYPLSNDWEPYMHEFTCYDCGEVLGDDYCQFIATDNCNVKYCGLCNFQASTEFSSHSYNGDTVYYNATYHKVYCGNTLICSQFKLMPHIKGTDGTCTVCGG